MLLAVLHGTAYAQRTDVVRLANGDHITGEVYRLERGQLTFKTDDAGTVYFEWDKVDAVVAVRQFEVITEDGRHFLGSLGPAPPGSMLVVEAFDQVTLPLADVSEILPIGMSFWKKLDGSLDIGFNYTKSSEIAQLNLNTTTVFRKPLFEIKLAASGTLTQNGSDGERDDRGTLTASYLRYRGPRLFLTSGVGFESNESLGLLLRSQVAFAVGARLVNTSRAQLGIGAGISGNEEKGLDTEPTQNIEALILLRQSYYTYDRPRTNIDLSLQYYPSLTDFGRQRIQLDTGLKREVWKDVFFSVNVFDTFDSRPPNPDAATNDVGIVLSFGWTY